MMYSKTTRDAVKFEVEKYTISRFGFVLNVVQSDTIDPVTNSNDILGFMRLLIAMRLSV